MYQRIDEHPTARAIYTDRLAQEGVIERQDAEKQAEDHQHHLAATQQKLRQELSSAAEGEEPVRISGAWTPIAEPETAVPEEAIRSLNHQLVTVPDGFTITPKLKRQLNKRLEALGGRKWVVPQLMAAAPAGVEVRFVSRPERSSPAEGYPAAHQREQERLVTESLR